ncbi:MAG: tRNA-binding protein [Deltaproteobacteria bacterium]|nr:tRNA-binding protein [Deltaproteobacteria bacterium]
MTQQSTTPQTLPLTYEEFERVEIRVGTIVDAVEFPEARKPAWRLRVDLGQLGIKSSSAQVKKLYTREELVGRQVVCVVNFPPKQIGPMMSEVLVTGFRDQNGDTVLASVERLVPNGERLF